MTGQDESGDSSESSENSLSSDDEDQDDEEEEESETARHRRPSVREPQPLVLVSELVFVLFQRGNGECR